MGGEKKVGQGEIILLVGATASEGPKRWLLVGELTTHKLWNTVGLGRQPGRRRP